MCGCECDSVCACAQARTSRGLLESVCRAAGSGREAALPDPTSPARRAPGLPLTVGSFFLSLPVPSAGSRFQGAELEEALGPPPLSPPASPLACTPRSAAPLHGPHAGPFPPPALSRFPPFSQNHLRGGSRPIPENSGRGEPCSCLGTRTRTGWGQGRAGAEHPSRRCVRLCLRPDPKAAPSSHQRESCPEMEEPLALQTRPDWRRVGLFEASTLRAPELSPGPGLGPPGCPSARVVFPEHLLSARSSRLALSTPTAAQQGPWWCPGPAAEEADRGEGTCLKGQNQGPRPERCRAPPSPQGPELPVSSPVRVAARRLPGLLSHLLPTHPSDRSGKSRWERGRELRSQTSRARAWALCLFSFPNPRASLSSPLPVPGAAGALGAALRERPCGQSALSRQQPRPKASRRHLRKQSPSLPGAEKLR